MQREPRNGLNEIWLRRAANVLLEREEEWQSSLPTLPNPTTRALLAFAGGSFAPDGRHFRAGCANLVSGMLNHQSLASLLPRQKLDFIHNDILVGNRFCTVL